MIKLAIVLQCKSSSIPQAVSETGPLFSIVRYQGGGARAQSPRTAILLVFLSYQTGNA